jgi:hypothetical protein
MPKVESRTWQSSSAPSFSSFLPSGISSFVPYELTFSEEIDNRFWMNWFNEASFLDLLGHKDSALDVVYRNIDLILRQRHLEGLDCLFAQLDPRLLSTDLILAFLTATLPAKNSLPNRQSFVVNAQDALRRSGRLQPGMLEGLVD